MNTHKKIIITAITAICATFAIFIYKYTLPGANANIVFDDQGRVIHADGEHNQKYYMYDKDGNIMTAMPGKTLCEMYGTSDVYAAAEKFAASKGWIWVPTEYWGNQEQINSYIANKVGAQPTPQQNQSTESEITTTTTTEIRETPKHNHGIYEGITDEALVAFEYFTHDGVADSCYIQIKENADQRTMFGSHISKTAANSEFGEVQFVNDDGEVVYKFVFPQVSTDDGFSMELTPTIETVDEGIKVDFKDEKLYNMDLGFEVDFFFQTGKPGTKFYVYTSEADGLHEYNTITTDADGFVRLPYTMVQDYTFSETDLVAAAEEARAQAEEEAKKAEEAAKAAAEAEIQVEQTKEPAIEVEPTEPIVIEEKNNTPFILIGVCTVILIGAGILIARKLRK